MPVQNVIGIAQVGQPHQPVFMTGIRGINNSMPDDLIDDQELSDASNYVVDMNASGMLVKREGLTKQSALLTEAVTSIFDGIEGDYFSTSTKIFTLNGTERVSGLTSTTNPDWTRYNDRDIYVDGTNADRVTTNGTTFSNLGGTPPTAKYVESFNQMVFMAGHNENDLRWSDYGTSATWPAINALTFTDIISGMKRWDNSLMLFGENSFYHIVGYNETSVQVAYANYEEGCTSHRSIVVSPYGISWWSKNGLVLLRNGQRILDYIAKRKIPKTLDGLNRGQYGLVHGIWNPIQERLEYFFHNGTSSTVDKKIYYYPRLEIRPGEFTDAFFVGDGAGVQMGASGVIVESGVANVYVGSAATNLYVYKQSGSTDDGTNITSYLETKRIAPSGLTALNRLRRISPMFYLTGSSEATIGIFLDSSISANKSWNIGLTATGFTLGTSALDVGQLGGGEEPFITQISYPQRYRRLKVRVSDSSAFRTRFLGTRIEGYVLAA